MTDDTREDGRDDPADGEGDPFEELPDRDGGGTDPFEELFGAVDPDGSGSGEAWEELRERVDTERLEASDTLGGADGETHTVPKGSFCEDCRFLSAPPEFSCTHEGTEIVDFADRDHVRVRNCPVVRERQRLGDLEDTIQ